MPEAPERTAFYRLLDSTGDLLYVGITNDPESRLRAHRMEKPWWPQVDGISIEWFEGRYKAAQAETKAITTECPRYNLSQTEAWRAQQSATAWAVTPEKRRNRSVGLKARTVQVRTFRDLTAQGVPEAEAAEEARLARERYIAADRLARRAESKPA